MPTWINTVSCRILPINLLIVQYYLPPEKQVTKDFLKLVFTNEKRLLKKNEVSYIHVSHWDELAVKHLWPDMQKDPNIMVYFSNDYAADKGPCREYFFNILNTVHPEYLAQIMAHASKERFAAEGEK